MTPRRRQLLVALLCVLCAGLLAPPVASQEPDSIDEAKEEREEARRAQLAAVINLSLVDAEDEEIVAALEAATELVNLEQAKVDAASQRLRAVEDARGDARAALEQTVIDLALLSDAAREYAVESYVGLGDQRTQAAWLNSDDVTTGAHKAALLDITGGETVDVLDQLKALEARRADLALAAENAAADADEIAAELDVSLLDLEAQRQVQVQLKAEVDARRAEWEAALETAESEEQELTAFIQEQEAKAAAELEARRKAATAAAGQGQAPTGIISEANWTWPTGGGVASGFGQRLHPILGYYRMHSGLDIGGAQGQPIWAATEGIVIMAGWNGGYGNTVIIQHANGTTTLYAHMSGFSVSNGAYVGTGDVIGSVGSTGLSTGPHLHFEVRVNGSPVDPRPYLP